MELKHANLNGKIILVRYLNLVKLFFLKNNENWIQKLIRQKDALTAPKTR